MNSKTEITKARVYLASPFFNDEQVERVKRVEQALEANPFVEAYFSPRKEQLDSLPFGSPQWANAVYQNDIKNIDWATHVVAVIDYDGETFLHGERHGHVDSGTAMEIGYAVASKKPVILVHEKGGIVNLMLSESCHAYLTSTDYVAEYNFLNMPKMPYKGGYI
ncbi:nucleoside 2-deoxyribosyltransferase [Virgibacillus pantothenticus]|uniref:nucleoside 2-deoxyribosyltransferase n=1 Tax=Virgibacillus pantothenticus TaxID=1473 RepID=UPI000985DFA2|nr:nucleoside 2-deoxyribosyltransferase [Virgibacillus pantothenticus]